MLRIRCRKSLVDLLSMTIGFESLIELICDARHKGLRGRSDRNCVEVQSIMSKSLTSEFQSSAGSVMIRVPAGSFTMGSPESEDGHRAWEQQREVTFASDLYLGKTPVTQDQFEAVAGTNPTVHEEIGDAPVDSVYWDQAKEYCLKLTQ